MPTTMPQEMILQLPTDRLILEDLSETRRDLGANIADRIDRHRKTVASRLRQLEDYDFVTGVGRGVYEITDRGRVALEHIDEYSDDVDFESLIDESLEDQ